jgi:hypothetical protein
MYKNSILIPVVLYISVFLCSFNHHLSDNAKIEINIHGVDHDFLREGIEIAQFNQMSIQFRDEIMVVQAFQITLARGTRSIDISDVRGNSFNLRKYIRMARPGDRIVIEVKRTSADDDLNSQTTTIFVLKVL